MRKLAPVLMACLLGMITTVDRVACPDGCTDSAPLHRSDAAAPSVCGLCHGWSGPTLSSDDRPIAQPARAFEPPDAIEHAAHLPAIDHPPRVA